MFQRATEQMMGGGDQRQWWRVLPWVGLIVVALSVVAGFLGFIPGMWAQDALLVIFVASVFALRRDVLSVVVLVVIALLVDWYQLLPMPHTVYETALLGGIALLVLIVIAGRKQHPWRELRWRDLVLWAIFLLLGVLAIPRGYNIPIAPKLLLITSVQYVSNTFLIGCVFWFLGALIVREPTQLRQLFSLLALYGALVGLHATLQEMGTFILLTPHQAAFLAQPIVNHFYLAGTHTPRATSFFLEPDIAESFLSSVALLPLGLLVASRSWTLRALYGVELLLTLLGLLFTYGPVGWGVFVICLVLFLPFGLRGRARAYVLGALAAAVVIGLALLPKVLHTVVKRAASPHELGLRLQIWTSALHAIAANPLLGFGLGEGNVWALRMRPYLVPGLSPNHPHAQNSFLEIAAVAGIPTLVALLLLLGTGLYYAVQKYRLADWTMRPIILSGALTVVALCLNGASDTTWTANMIVPLGWLIVGALSSPMLTQALGGSAPTPGRDAQAGAPGALYPVRYGPDVTHTTDPHRGMSMLDSQEEGEYLTEATMGQLAGGPAVAAQVGLPTTTEPHLAIPGGGGNATPGTSATASGEAPGVAGEAAAPDDAASSALSYFATLRKTLSNAGFYTIASFAGPLISLILTPYLTNHLSLTDYGMLAVLSVSITLIAAITQLGMASSFFRVYNYEYDSQRDRRRVLSTSVTLTLLQTVPCVLLIIIFAPTIARVLLHSESLGSAVLVTALIILVQNLTVPGVSWLRGENRASLYLVIAVAGLVANLVATILLVGVFNLGLVGALLASGAGFALMTLVTLPVTVARAGLTFNREIAWSMFTFGAPQVFSLMSGWVLQVSDRWLLGLLASYSVVASYSVAYTLGGTVSTLVIAPFQLTWPPALYSIAKRPDAPKVYRTVFRYYGPILLYAALGIAILGKLALNVLFSKNYDAAAPVIPIVAESLALYGCYAFFLNGVFIKRTIWLAAGFMTAAALTNFACNLVLIPRYGAMGAAVATLIGYGLLAVIGYVADQRIYPIPYEIGRFGFLLLTGVAIYATSSYLSDRVDTRGAWAVAIGSLVLYPAIVLAVIVRRQDIARIRALLARRPWLALGRGGTKATATPRPQDARTAAAKHVCMYQRSTARTDVRMMREARSLVDAGYEVTIVDLVPDRATPKYEEAEGIHFVHLAQPDRFRRTRFKPWFVVKTWRRTRRAIRELKRIPADAYHGRDFEGILACVAAARPRHRKVVFDSYELPLVQRELTKWRFFHAIAVRRLRRAMPHVDAAIVVSPPLAEEMRRRFGGPLAVTVRNIPAYQEPIYGSNRLRETLGLAADIRIALYQGGLQANRSLHLLIESAPYLAPGNVIALMGYGPLQEPLRRMIEERGLSDRVKLVAAAPYDELLSWTSSADLGLTLFDPAHSLSIKYSLPNKLFEYLMAGLPVLSSNLPAIVDILRAYHVGAMVDSLEPRAIATAINSLFEATDAIDMMRRNGLSAARTDLNWEAEQQRLVQLYDTLLMPTHSRRVPAPAIS